LRSGVLRTSTSKTYRHEDDFRKGQLRFRLAATSPGTMTEPLTAVTSEHAPTVRNGTQHPVLALLKTRLESDSRPNYREPGDTARLALVIEGGGMRGVVAAGMVTALHQLGIRKPFDLVVGTSAGALAGAFYLAGQPAMGTSMYYEDLISKDWLDYRRFLWRKPIISLDYLIDTLMTSRKILDCDRVISSDIPLYAVATRTSDWKPAILGGFRSPDELLHALRASARIPIVSGRPVRIDVEEYLDGSVAESIPVDSAVDRLHATHVLVLRTRSVGQLRGRPGLFSKAAVYPVMNMLVDGLGSAYATRAARYKQEVDRLAAMQEGTDSSGWAFTVQLDVEAPGVRQMEQNPAALFAGAAAGAAAVYRALTGQERRFYAGLSVV
jgi:predicted patatin/cPLA2 family phospholipase